MAYDIKPMTFDPKNINGFSEKLLVSHYENNYSGTVRRLNALTAQLAEIDFSHGPGEDLPLIPAIGEDFRQERKVSKQSAQDQTVSVTVLSGGPPGHTGCRFSVVHMRHLANRYQG